jgi:signal transduction histidine kinase
MGGARTDLSKLVTAALLASFLLLAATVGIAMALMAASENRQVAGKTRMLVRTAIESYETSLEQFAVDYFNWTASLEAMAQGDERWLYENVGVVADLTDYALDVALFATPDGRPIYGWIAEGGIASRPDAIPPGATEELFDQLDEIDPKSKGVVIAYTEIDGTLWMLAATRMAANEGPAGEADAEMNRAVIGYRIDEGAIAEIVDPTLLEGLRFVAGAAEPELGEVLALRNADGQPLAWVAWPQPTSGWRSLLRVLPAIVAVLGLVAAIMYVAGRAIRRNARNLESALIAARAADVAKTEFLTNISHELRTPISGIAGVTEVLAMDELTAAQREMVQIIAASAEAQLGLIEELVDISSLETGSKTLAHLPFDPEREVRTVVGLMRPQAMGKAIGLTFGVDGSPPPMVIGDAGAFRQILTNLVGNAVKFTDEGSVGVELSAKPSGGGAELVVTVTDTGPGIPKKQRARIFERFVQANGSSTREKGGSGLGLAISQGLAGLMDGAIRILDRAGPGSTFELRLHCEMAETEVVEAA